MYVFVCVRTRMCGPDRFEECSVISLEAYSLDPALPISAREAMVLWPVSIQGGWTWEEAPRGGVGGERPGDM